MTGLAHRFDAIRAERGPLCVGIDPSSETLRAWGLDDTADGVIEFGRVILAAAAGTVGIVKPQVGYFERFGSAGYQALEILIEEARHEGLCVIADSKRGDIGTTMSGYARAWLGPSPLHSDAMTVSPYQGFAALEPAFVEAESSGGVVFVLCATSNPDSRDVQGAHHDAESVPATIARLARHRNGAQWTAGLVVGATRALSDSSLRESDLDGLLILAPGFGAQGASLTDVGTIFGTAAQRVIPSVSRSLTVAGPNGVANAIQAHLRELGI